MARLRFKLEINPGGHGVRLDKLGKLSEAAERFLRNLADDAGAKIAVGDFVASDFYEGSFGSFVEAIGDYTPEAVAQFDAGVTFFAEYGTPAANDDALPALAPRFSKKTIQSFASLGDSMENDEAIRIGLVSDEGGLRWQKLTKSSMVLVRNLLAAPYEYQGAIQGRLGTWYRESNYFNLKPVAATNTTVKCHYTAGLYARVHAAFEDKDAVVHVIGVVTAERMTGDPTDIAMADIKIYPRLSDRDFASLAGSDPRIIGDEDVVDVIDRMRDDAD